jgi:hypothetical protein
MHVNVFLSGRALVSPIMRLFGVRQPVTALVQCVVVDEVRSAKAVLVPALQRGAWTLPTAI